MTKENDYKQQRCLSVLLREGRPEKAHLKECRAFVLYQGYFTADTGLNTDWCVCH